MYYIYKVPLYILSLLFPTAISIIIIYLFYSSSDLGLLNSLDGIVFEQYIHVIVNLK